MLRKIRLALLLSMRLRSRSGAGSGAIAVAGVGLAVAVMLLSVAVLQGFKEGIRSRVTSFEAPVTIAVATGNQGAGAVAEPLQAEPWLVEAAAQAAPEASLRPAAVRPVMLKTADEFSGLLLKGVDSAALAAGAFPQAAIVRGRQPLQRDEIAVSELTARSLRADTGERLWAAFFVRTPQGGESMKVRRFTVSGIYDSGFGDYDLRFAFTPLGALASVDGLRPGQGTRLELWPVPDGRVDDVAALLQDATLRAAWEQRTPKVLAVDNVHRAGAIYFAWLDMLDTNVAVILGLMAVVAAFTVVSSLFILVLANVGVIGLLKAEGAGNSLIRLTYMLMSLRQVALGLLAGDAVGLGLLWLQKATGLVPLDPATYYMSTVPVEIGFWAVAAINAGMIVLAFMVMVLPSHIVATLSPAATLRYE